MTTRDEILDAALALVAVAGVPGLTFEAVDDEAKLDLGTTAAAFPTVDALIDAMLGRLITLDGQAWLSTGTSLNPSSVGEFADRMAGLVVTHVEVFGRATLARFALFLGRPQTMTSGQAALLDVISVILDTLGVPEPDVRARHVADLVGGAALHLLTVRRDEPINQAALAAAFRRLLR